MIRLPSEIMDILGKNYFAYFCTVGSDDRPHVTPMFFIFNPESSEVYLITSSRSKKIRNIRENSQVSLTIDVRDPVNPFNNSGVMVQGSSTINGLPVESTVGRSIYRQFNAKYPDFADKLQISDKVILKVVPRRIVYWRGAQFTSVKGYSIDDPNLNVDRKALASV